ncbi:serine hydrolase-like protein [Gracilinanus agilis]|uniref:serine hydrolase-like protein n=1 Tax=Gracilinanus agilis TaxID=191870 RepID=UPI001CFF3DE5|nr:serine hydrolase-like protein [Gracilinanus agilis]
MGVISELKVSVPWGHIAAKVWGSPQGPPVLCLHGWLDNANSFDRLIPLLPQTFRYVAMDLGGHGLSSHHHPGFQYHKQDYVNEVRRVAAALSWKRFSFMGHSFGGMIGSMFSCMFPEMVDKLILLDSIPFFLDTKELSDLLAYKRRAIEHVLYTEELQRKPRRVLPPEEMLKSFLKNNIQVGEECGKLLLERGTTKVAQGVVLNRDRRLGLPENTFDYLSQEQAMYFCQKIQARVLLIKAKGGYSYFRPNAEHKDTTKLVRDFLQSILKERCQTVVVEGTHYVHMQEPHRVAEIITHFLEDEGPVQAPL